MTLCLLVRHAAHDLLGKVLVGRTPGVALNASGRRQAHELGHTLRALGITKIQSSPRLRAVETASAMASRHGLGIEVSSELDELDFGDWNGCSFAELADDAEWRRWNSYRSQARAPRGDSMAEVQARIIAHLGKTRRDKPKGRVAMVTHAEVIRAAVLHCIGRPIDAWTEVDFAPASAVHVHWAPGSSRPVVQFARGMAAA